MFEFIRRADEDPQQLYFVGDFHGSDNFEDKNIAKVGCHQAQENAQAGIEREMKKIAVFKQGDIFAGKGRECGKSSAKSYGKEHPPLRVQDIAFLRQSVKDANEQAAGHIHDERAKGEGRKKEVLKIAGRQKPGDWSQETTGTGNQN